MQRFLLRLLASAAAVGSAANTDAGLLMDRARWLRDARDSGDELEDTGYVEDADGDGFRYLRTAGAIRREGGPPEVPLDPLIGEPEEVAGRLAGDVDLAAGDF